MGEKWLRYVGELPDPDGPRGCLLINSPKSVETQGFYYNGIGTEDFYMSQTSIVSKVCIKPGGALHARFVSQTINLEHTYM